MAEHERFLDIAGGDPELARVVYDNLRRFEEGAGGPAMQQLARDVLAGRISLREAANSGAYADAFRDSVPEHGRHADPGEQTPDRAETGQDGHGAPGQDGRAPG